jgi:hypothetical protein
MESHIRELSETEVPSALVHRSMNIPMQPIKTVCLSRQLCMIIKHAVRASTRTNWPRVRDTRNLSHGGATNISRMFEKILNDPGVLIRGLGETDK